MNSELITSLIRDLLYVVLLGTIPIISRYIISFLDAKREEITSRSDEVIFEKTVSNALKIIEDVVNTVSQTYVDELKEKGEFTKEAQKEAFNKALTLSKELIDEESQELLVNTFTDLDAWIGVAIESYIKKKDIKK